MLNIFRRIKLFVVVLLVGCYSLSATVSTFYGFEVDAIIFDCDGVLVDTEQVKLLALQKALAAKNISLGFNERSGCRKFFS